MKKLSKMLLLIMAGAIVVCAAAGCSGNSNGGNTTESSASDTVSDDNNTVENNSAESQTEESSDGQASVDLATADYSNPAVTIEFGDFELIQTVTQDMQTGKYDGQVIKVTGISQKRMSNCALIERDESTGTGYGMTYYLDGNPDLSEYPAEDAKVEVLGVVTVGDYDVRALTVLPSNIKTLDQ